MGVRYGAGVRTGGGTGTRTAGLTGGGRSFNSTADTSGSQIAEMLRGGKHVGTVDKALTGDNNCDSVDLN